MNTKTVKYGISLPDAFLLAFVILKLCNVIDWSWVWVISPLWLQCLVSLIVEIIKIRLERKKQP